MTDDPRTSDFLERPREERSCRRGDTLKPSIAGAACTAALATLVAAALVGALSLAHAGQPPSCADAERQEVGALPLIGIAGMDPRPFQELTGTSIRLVHTFVPKREGWAPLRGENAGGRLDVMARALAQHANTVGLISYPPIPARIEGSREEALAKCAAGQFNDHYAAYSRGMMDRRLDRVILRIGWEWDDDFPWGAKKDVALARLFGACFANVVRSIREAYPDNRILFDWNSTMAVTPELLEAGYPGDAYVDIVSVEGYDGRGGADPERRWRATERAFNLVRDFGKARGKKLAFPEWGIVTHWKNPKWGGGDNPLHVQRVCEYAKDPANNVHYLSYFNRSVATSNHRLEDHPRSLEAFRTHCGSIPVSCPGGRP